MNLTLERGCFEMSSIKLLLCIRFPMAAGFRKMPAACFLGVAALFLVVAGCGGGNYRSPVTERREIAIPADAPEELRELLTRLNSEDAPTRALAAARLGDRSDAQSPSTPFLLQALKDPNVVVRTRAAESLGKVGEASVVQTLMDTLSNRQEDREVRTRAAQALGELRATEAVQTLVSVLNDPVWHIRYHAMVALGKIGDPAAAEPLAESARYDPDQDNRNTARQVLEQLGVVVEVQAEDEE